MDDAKKSYLGDSVYASNDGWHIILYTDNGDGPKNQIYLEPEVYDALLKYHRSVHAPKLEANE